MDASIEAKVSAWQDNVTESDLVIELDELCREGNEDKLFDAFYPRPRLWHGGPARHARRGPPTA